MTALPVALISHPEPAPILRPFPDTVVYMSDILHMAQVVAVAKLAHEAKPTMATEAIYSGAMKALQEEIDTHADQIRNGAFTGSRSDCGRRVVVTLRGGVVGIYVENML